MPKSRIRKKAVYTPPVAVSNRKKYGSPWVGPAMATMFVIGVAWLVVYYLAESHNVPLPDQLVEPARRVRLPDRGVRSRHQVEVTRVTPM